MEMSLGGGGCIPLLGKKFLSQPQCYKLYLKLKAIWLKLFRCGDSKESYIMIAKTIFGSNTSHERRGIYNITNSSECL